MNRTRFIKLSVFLLFLIAGWVYLNKVFASEHKFVNATAAFKTLTEKTNVDVLFIGSSHIYTAVNPHIINTQSKTLSFNLGSDGMRLELSSLVLQEALKYTSPKLIVVEIFRGSISPIETDVSKGFQLRALDFVSHFSADKWKLVNQVYNSNELIGVYSPFYRNHKNWNSEKYFDLDRKKNFNKDYVYFYDGFYGIKRNVPKEDRAKYSDFRAKKRSRDTTVNYLEPVHIAELEKLISLSLEHGFELLIQTSPDLKATSINNHFYDQIAEFCEQNKLKYLNLNTDYYYDLVDLTTADFKDSSHLNLQGGEKISAVVAEFINQNYNLPDRSNDAFWKTKTKAADELLNGKLIYQSDVIKPLNDQIDLAEIQIRKLRKNFKATLSFNDAGENSNRYNIGIQLYPKENNLDGLHPNSKAKNRAFDNGSGLIEDTALPLEAIIYSNVEEIKQFRIFLYDSSGYKGVVGKPLIIQGEELNDFE